MKSGTRYDGAARMSYQAACELGFVGGFQDSRQLLEADGRRLPERDAIRPTVD